MQKSQEPGKSLSPSQQLPSFTASESKQVEPSAQQSQDVFAAWEKASFKTQQILIASTVAIIAALAVLVVSQISAPSIILVEDAVFSRSLKIVIGALITGVTVGVTTMALGQITINSIKRSLDNLQAQFEALAQGNLENPTLVDLPNELGQLSISFNEMTQALNTRLKEAKREVEDQKKDKENLQQKLKQIIHTLESTSGNNLTVQAEEAASEDNEQDITAPGTLLDFLDNLHSWSQVTTAPDLLLGSSTLEEVQQRKEELEYRQVWLQALQDETQREIKILSLLCQTPDNNGVIETNEG